MRIITLETLKTMPNGTVFSEIDEWGNLERPICILTGRYDYRVGFNGTMTLFPHIAGDDGEGIFNMFENGKLIKDKDFPTEWYTVDVADIDYEKNQLFAVFSKAEICKMIKALHWALSGLEDDFDMDEVLCEENCKTGMQQKSALRHICDGNKNCKKAENCLNAVNATAFDDLLNGIIRYVTVSGGCDADLPDM